MSRFRRSRSTAVAALAFVVLPLAWPAAPPAAAAAGPTLLPTRPLLGSAGSINGQGATSATRRRQGGQPSQGTIAGTADRPDRHAGRDRARRRPGRRGRGRATSEGRRPGRCRRPEQRPRRPACAPGAAGADAALSGLMDKVVALGHENSRTDHGDDVTAQVADVGARVRELQISVGRLQDFLRHSGSIGDLVSLESQLTQRQSELDSTLSQQRALADQVDLATLTVDLSTISPVVRGLDRTGRFRLGAEGQSARAAAERTGGAGAAGLPGAVPAHRTRRGGARLPGAAPSQPAAAGCRTERGGVTDTAPGHSAPRAGNCRRRCHIRSGTSRCHLGRERRLRRFEGLVDDPHDRRALHHHLRYLARLWTNDHRFRSRDTLLARCLADRSGRGLHRAATARDKRRLHRDGRRRTWRRDHRRRHGGMVGAGGRRTSSRPQPAIARRSAGRRYPSNTCRTSRLHQLSWSA